MILVIDAFGRPAPQGSKELGGAGQLLEQSKYLPAWRAAVKEAAFTRYRSLGIDPAALPLIPRPLPVYVHLCTFYVGPTQCRAEGSDEPTGAPDVDKLLRAVLDALGGAPRSARVFEDDSQVTKVYELSKERASGDAIGARIIIGDTPKEGS